MAQIEFKTEIKQIGNWAVLIVPADASAKLPSRGLVMIKGTLNGKKFQTALEPDGKRSHWFKLDKQMLAASHVQVGDNVQLSIEPMSVWPEPEVPEDLRKALADDPKATSVWEDITPMARWDWIRWIRSTKNPETRARRIEVTFSKFRSEKRRPCCFNRTECTDPELSKSGVLIEPAHLTA